MTKPDLRVPTLLATIGTAVTAHWACVVIHPKIAEKIVEHGRNFAATVLKNDKRAQDEFFSTSCKIDDNGKLVGLLNLEVDVNDRVAEGVAVGICEHDNFVGAIDLNAAPPLPKEVMEILAQLGLNADAVKVIHL